MERDNDNYRHLAALYLTANPNFLAHADAFIDFAGVIVEMYSILNTVKNKNSESYKESLERWKKLNSICNTFQQIQSDNQILRRALMQAENELAEYERDV